MDNIVFATASELATEIRLGQLSAMQVLEAFLAQIEKHNSALNAIVTLDVEGARRRARAADEATARGKVWGPLHGVPITLKDVHDVARMRSTMGYLPFADRIATEDSIVVGRLRSAGAIVIGKTNSEIFPDNPFGRTHNPWDVQRTPGTSSSGAAAALAAGMTPLDFGSDTGGSVIEPSHYSGVFGIRPTERRVPLGKFPTDPVPIWRIVCVLGPMARSAADLRLALSIIAGADVRDTEVPPLDWREASPRALRDLRIAFVSTFPGVIVADDIRTAIEDFARELSRTGVQIEQCSPEVDFAEQTRLTGELVRLIVNAFTTTPTTLGDYLQILNQRDTFIARWEQFFDEWDAFLCPAGLTTAPLLAEQPTTADVEPVSLPGATGHPSAVIPLAHDHNGLPLGIQVIGKRWQDEELLNIVDVLTNVTGGFHRPPGY